MDDGSPLDGILDVDITLYRIYLLGETLMTYAYTSILAAVLLFIGVVQVDRFMLIGHITPDTLSYTRSEHLW
ncbi:hypothetical protein LWE69_19730 [Paenibacillus sp. UKAQ_18]|nr:hypothetical protein [Paenibacillus sp. UKAQ_18]